MAKDNLKRLNVYLNEDFFRFVSDYADKTGLSKSAVCVLALKDLRDREIMMKHLFSLGIAGSQVRGLEKSIRLEDDSERLFKLQKELKRSQKLYNSILADLGVE